MKSFILFTTLFLCQYPAISCNIASYADFLENVCVRACIALVVRADTIRLRYNAVCEGAKNLPHTSM